MYVTQGWMAARSDQRTAQNTSVDAGARPERINRAPDLENNWGTKPPQYPAKLRLTTEEETEGHRQGDRFSRGQQLASNSRPLPPKNHIKPSTTMQEKAKRANKIEIWFQIRSLPLYPSELQARS
jgi:hypothetical protein